MHKMTESAAELAVLFNVNVGGPADVDEMMAMAEEARIRQHLDLIRQLEATQAGKHSGDHSDD